MGIQIHSVTIFKSQAIVSYCTFSTLPPLHLVSLSVSMSARVSMSLLFSSILYLPSLFVYSVVSWFLELCSKNNQTQALVHYIRIVAFNKSLLNILLADASILFINENNFSTAAFESGNVNKRETTNKGNSCN